MPLLQCERIVMFFLLANLVKCCQFPKALQARTWYTDIKPSIGTQTVVYFWADIMESQSQRTSSSDILYITQKYCLKAVTNDTFIISTERDPQSPTVNFYCLQFVHRSDSIVQFKTSKSTKLLSHDLCKKHSLHLQPSLMVALSTVHTDHVSCPISGGFDMKIIHQNNMDHICNSNDIPMRFESNCFTGEGVIFNFKEESCIGDLPMSVTQRASCVTSWQQGEYRVIVLRKSESSELWCLLYPLDGQQTVLLYTDLLCPTDAFSRSSGHHYSLLLTLVPQPSLCADEHKDCGRLPCIEPFIGQCLRTCGRCDPRVAPTTCDFPHNIRGEWFVNGHYKNYNITVSDSSVQLGDYGRFDCVTRSDYRIPASGTYTTVSLFTNGCKPRYTCFKFKSLGVNSVGVAVSQSLVWPLRSEHIRSLVCNSNNFEADLQPYNDTYRTYNDVFKPAVNLLTTRGPLACALDNIYDIIITGVDKQSCRGTMYQNCEDATHIRVESDNCSLPLADDFSCLGQIKGKYWEKIILIQNHKDAQDTRCVFFSEIRPDRVLIMASAECDQFSWSFVDARMRTPMLDMAVTAKYGRCKTIRTLPETRKSNYIKSRDLNAKLFNKNSNSLTSFSVTPKGGVQYREADYSLIGSTSGLRASEWTLLSFLTSFMSLLVYNS